MTERTIRRVYDIEPIFHDKTISQRLQWKTAHLVAHDSLCERKIILDFRELVTTVLAASLQTRVGCQFWNCPYMERTQIALELANQPEQEPRTHGQALFWAWV